MMEPEEMEQLANDLREELTNITDTLRTFRDEISNKDLITFLGKTRNGKSTVISYLMGIPLQAFKNQWHQYKIAKVHEGVDEPRIGHGSASTTTNLKLYPRNNSDVIYADTAGFDDNRGDVQAIKNSLFLNQLSYARKCTFVLVSDISNILNDAVGEFVDLIKTTCNLIPSATLCDSVSLLITKVEYQWTPSDIADLLDNKILQSGISLSNTELQLVRHFVDHSNVIALFRKPKCEGELTTESDVNIENAISNCSSLDMNTVTVRITPSEGAQLAVFNICTNFAEELHFINELEAAIIEYTYYFVTEDYVFASTDEELEIVKNYMTVLENNLIHEKNKNQWNFHDILNLMTCLIQDASSTKCYKTLELFVILEDLGLLPMTIQDIVINKYRDSLNIVTKNISDLLEKIKAEERVRARFWVFLHLVRLADAGTTAVQILEAIASILEALTATSATLGAGGITVGYISLAVSSFAAPAAAALLLYVYHTRKEKQRIAREQQGR